MAKKKSDKERAIAFFTTAPKDEVMSLLDTVNMIAVARGFGPPKRASSKKKDSATDEGKKAGDGEKKAGGKKADTSGKAGAGTAGTESGKTPEQSSAASAGS